MSAFQTTQPTPSSLLATASRIVATSALALDGDDHTTTVQIVAQALGKLPPDQVDNFVIGGADPATAAQIVYAALGGEMGGALHALALRTSAPKD